MSSDWKEPPTTAGRHPESRVEGLIAMERGIFGRRGLLGSMVRAGYASGINVLRSPLSTLVLRIWAGQPIGGKDREWQSYGVKRTGLRGVGVAYATRSFNNWEYRPVRNALMGQ
jgi:hypothetical protein